MLDRITTDPKVCHGQACVKGTRIPVFVVLDALATGMTVDQIIKDLQQAGLSGAISRLDLDVYKDGNIQYYDDYMNNARQIVHQIIVQKK